MATCYNCGAINSTAPIQTPDGNEFILVSKPSNGSFNIPPNGLLVKVIGCNKCGVITLGTEELIGKEFTK